MERAPHGRVYADDLAAERERFFVGRAAELERLVALLAPTAKKRVALVSGPGGIGKTELVLAFARLARARGAGVAWIDGHDLTPSETAFAESIAGALAAVDAPSDDIGDTIGERRLRVLVIDRFELLSALEPWFRDRCLPTLDASLRIVVVGRTTLAPAWAASTPGSSLVESLPLVELPEAVVAEFLARRGVSAERSADVRVAACGHPLALALFAEVALRDPTRPIHLAGEPAIVQLLVGTMLDGVPDDAHRQALWSAALLRHTTEELLAAMVDADKPTRASALFDWLQRRAFMRTEPRGLEPHDVVRELLVADITHRHPQLRLRLLARAARHLRAAIHETPRQRLPRVMEAAYLWRAEVPIIGLDTAGLYTSPVRPEDWPALEAMVVPVHGGVGWALFRHWAERGGELVIVRGSDGQPQGSVVYLRLDRLEPDAVAADPGVAQLHAYLAARGELAGAMCWRFLIDRDTFERPSSSTTVLTAYEFEHFICDPDATAGYGFWRDPAPGLATLPPGMLVRLPAADFTLDGRDYHAIRTTASGGNLLAWCLDGLFAPLVDAAVATVDGKALADHDFASAVRAALRDFHRPERLAKNPLAQRGVTTDAASALAGVEALRARLRAAGAALGDGEEDGALRRVLEATYFSPRAKQVRVALDANMPFGTYRRRLALATERVVAWLWLGEAR